MPWSQIRVVLFAIDVRALAALRICMAGILTYDAVASLLSTPTNAMSSITQLPILYNGALLLPCALAMGLGASTRLATIGCWVVFLVRVRYELVTVGWVRVGDYILLLLLFWSMFLPLGAAWSLDRRRGRASPRPARRFLSVATAALLIQIALIYYSAGIAKSFTEWGREATALHIILSGEEYPTPIGRALVGSPVLLAALTRATIVLEILGPPLLFLPPVRPCRWVRPGVVAAFIAFHLGMVLCMKLGTLPLVCLSAWLVFLPSRVWDAIGGRGGAAPTACTIDRSRALNLAAAVFLAYILLSAVLAFTAGDARFARLLQQPARHAGLHQQWLMFNSPSKIE